MPQPLFPEISIKTIRSWAGIPSDSFIEHVWQRIARKSFQMGADYELNKSREWVEKSIQGGKLLSESLVLERRPGSPSKKQQALQQLKGLIQNGTSESEVDKILEVLENISEES